jgi:predicted permease
MRRTRLEFGGLDQVKEACREARGIHFIEILIQDVRYGLRQLRRSPGFAIIAVLTLALGIGANTAIFSVVNGVLLNPLPYSEPDRLVTVDARKPDFPRGSISYPNFLDWHRMNQSFSFFAVSRLSGYQITGAGEPEELNAAMVTSDFFPMLGVKPVLGRGFTPSEDEIGTSSVVAISTALWERKFGSAPDIIGKGLTLDGREYTIVGVFPGRLDLPMSYFNSVDIYASLGGIPIPAIRSRSAGLGIHGLARLKPGVTIEQARADMENVTRYLAQTYPDADTGTGATLVPMKESMVGGVRSFLLLLLGAVGLVLLIACVNVGNLLLARGAGRRREIAVRAALGAGIGRLVRQMLTESILLALAGGALGFAIARAGTSAALAALPATLPRSSEVGVDARVLCCTLLVSVCAGILFGLAPAIRVARRSMHETLQEGGRGVLGRGQSAQGALVVAQIALAVVLLTAAGLMIRSLARLWNSNPGFNPDRVLTFNVALSPQMMKAPPEAIRAALRSFDAGITATPGVEAESLTWGSFPMNSEDDTVFWIEGQPRPLSDSEMNRTLDYIVGPDYLKAMRIPLLAGRFLSDRDDEHSKPVAVVDEVLARKYFPNGDALGKSIHIGNTSTAYEIVGVVGHVKQWGMDVDDQNAVRSQVYFAIMQLDDKIMALVPSGTSVVVGFASNFLGQMDSVRRAVQRSGRGEVISSVQTVHEIIESSLAPQRFAMILLGAFAAMALLLAGIGLYGVIAYVVVERTNEIGIRMALGALHGRVLRWILWRGFRLALAGVVAGLVGAAVLTRLLARLSLLFQVSATDPLTFTAVAALLLLVALAASYLPARRAARVDPVVALRHE